MQQKVKEIIELLIDKVDINLKDDDGFTMLHLAVINNHSRVVELLLTHNANAHILSPGKMDILQIAVRKSYFATVNLLLKHNSFISGAVKELLINFANTIIDEENSWTLTHISASRGYTEIIKLLLDNNIDITVRDNVGNTPLHLSAESGCITITKYFIAKGANIKLPNSVGDTPLHLAIYSENYNYTVISILVKKGTPINIPHHEGITSQELVDDIGDLILSKIFSQANTKIEEDELITIGDNAQHIS